MTSECVAVDTTVMVDEQPARAILDLARRVGADLIAMSTHGRGGVRRLMLGSVADKVVRGADAAVLLIRPHAGDRGAGAHEAANGLEATR